MRPGHHVTAGPYVPRNAPRVVNINVVRKRDPTQTVALRNRFAADMTRGFRKIERAILVEVGRRNAFGIADPQTGRLITHDSEPRFDFRRTDDKVLAFMRWLQDLERRHVLRLKRGQVLSSRSTRWSDVYIDTAYQRAIRDAAARLRRGGVRVEDSWIASAFNRPVHADRVALIYTRVFSELYDVTRVMDEQISEVLSLGLAEGRGPMDIARRLADRVRKIGITRARLIARTEVIAAHAEATLTSYEEAGITGVEVEAEWGTAKDDAVCPDCQAMEGKTFPLARARNMIPLHPNCRCAWFPKIIGGSGIVLNWRRRAPRNAQTERAGLAPAAVQRPHAHHRAGGDLRGRGAQRGAGHRH
jgi:SPP1 gp7 family putative phage head morphogenesis protein